MFNILPYLVLLPLQYHFLDSMYARQGKAESKSDDENRVIVIIPIVIITIIHIRTLVAQRSETFTCSYCSHLSKLYTTNRAKPLSLKVPRSHYYNHRHFSDEDFCQKLWKISEDEIRGDQTHASMHTVDKH